MSQGGGGGGDGGELEGLEAFLWEGEPWVLFDSDDSCGGHGETAMKPPETRSSIPSAPASNSLPGPSPVKRALDEDSKSSSSKGGGQEGKGGGKLEHDMYLRTKRERTKKMRTMFTNLHALLPQLPENVHFFVLRLHQIAFPSSFFCCFLLRNCTRFLRKSRKGRRGLGGRRRRRAIPFH